MAKQNRSIPVMNAVLDAVAERLLENDQSLIRIPEICDATGVNYGSVYHHFGSREGVIDATYEMIFERLVTQDIEDFEKISAAATSFDEYLTAFLGAAARYSEPERAKRRALRVRIIAASLMRPELRVRISIVQQRLVERLADVIAVGQERGWMRRDVSARAVSAALQALVVGRTLDDVSARPVDSAEWDQALQILIATLITRPNS
jgi:AcrR family transcriptional regulator